MKSGRSAARWPWPGATGPAYDTLIIQCHPNTAGVKSLPFAQVIVRSGLCEAGHLQANICNNTEISGHSGGREVGRY